MNLQGVRNGPERILAGASVARDVPAAARAPSALERAARAALFERLRGLTWGSITLRDGQGVETFGPASAAASGDAPAVELVVHDPRLYVDLAAKGSVGAGGAYIEGLWACDDLVGLVRILVRNRAVLEGLEKGLARLGGAALRWWHARRDNTRDGSRANIAAHYDLGNDFYSLFLDESMMYSCAIFESPEQTLEAAQRGRLARICRKLDLQPTDHLLEIGTGWGAMAVFAAREFGCRVTTTTISKEQYALARERVRAAGVADRVEVVMQDYRDLQGRFDKLVSIEMIEAVGERWFDAYFAKCSSLLAPNGSMLLQAITLRDQHYAQALKGVDFIQRFVFPGSCIPSTSAMLERTARVTDLALFHLEDLGPHYVRTLAEWRRRFFSRLDDVKAQGFSDEFVRLWDFYLCYCQGGFEERSISVAQLLFTKPLCRRAALTGAI
jgi:cyclopropane-fatty-acyl-phospholipid synthase